MLGVALTILFVALATWAGLPLVGRWSPELDPAERVGLAGLVSLGAIGLLTLLVGLVPGGLGFALYVVLAALIALAVLSAKSGTLKGVTMKLPERFGLLALLVLVAIGALALIAVLAPSLSTDWDTIAYHLAVPKLWLERGQIDFVQGIHHSNFPSTMEMLFMWGLKWGGQSGAKAFSLAVYVLGCASLFGLARRWYGPSVGWWAAVGFAGIPVVAWESGTGYIDVAHGLYATLAVLYACESLKKSGSLSGALVLSGVCLGFAMGTKYTGLQTFIALMFVLGTAALFAKGWKQAAVSKLTVAGVALLIACPWYVKTAVYTGNPVYPFFSNVLGGKDWDPWRASIYSAEQKSFGVGSSLKDVGHAVLGLGYQPGRYTNPRQDTGGGFPTGAIGFAALLAGVCAATCGRLRREERLVLATVGVGFAMWFVLSQQSRYLTMLAVPLVVLGAGQVGRVPWGRVLAGGFALQALVSLYMVAVTQTHLQSQVVFGSVSEEEYLQQLLPIYADSKVLNSLSQGSRVALYDEVFGFYLDVPYFWANPGHSMLIPYEGMEDSDDYVAALTDLGFTHVYVGSYGGDQRLLRAVQGEPYTAEEQSKMFEDLNTRWKLFLAGAVAQGRLRPVSVPSRAQLFEVVR